MSARRASPFAALIAIATVSLGALAAPAAEAPTQQRQDAAALASIEAEALVVHARAGDRDATRPVLIPGHYWESLGAPPQRLSPDTTPRHAGARSDPHSPQGWVLAHSTATSLP